MHSIVSPNKSASILVPRITALTLTAVRALAQAAIDLYLPPAPVLRLTGCISLLLNGYRSTGQTDGRIDTRPLQRRLPHCMRPASIIQSLFDVY